MTPDAASDPQQSWCLSVDIRGLLSQEMNDEQRNANTMRFNGEKLCLVFNAIQHDAGTAYRRTIVLHFQRPEYNHVPKCSSSIVLDRIDDQAQVRGKYRQDNQTVQIYTLQTSITYH